MGGEGGREGREWEESESIPGGEEAPVGWGVEN